MSYEFATETTSFDEILPSSGFSNVRTVSFETSTADSTNQIAADLLLNSAASGLGGSFSTSASAGGSYGSSYTSGGAYNSGTGFNTGSNYAISSANAGNASGSIYLSEIENSILRSQNPIQINESEEITINGQRGIWANRSEVVNWRGVIPITEYQINEDSNPEIITKRSNQQLDYIQELAIRYLRPPTPPAPGEIIIQQQNNILTPPAPPLIIRQQPARASTPEPLVVREAPPQPPAQVGRKVITISGRRIPPPPRKVIIERLAQLPPKPQSVIVERWLPYQQVKRRVIFQKNTQADPVIVRPRNVIVQWEAPRANIRKEIKYLGVIRANPAEYVQRYSSTLKTSNSLPQFVLDIKTPDGLSLAANYRYNNLHELEGDLQAFRLVDLDREGLAEYRSYLQRLGISYDGRSIAESSSAYGASSNNAIISSSTSSSLRTIAEQIFSSLDINADKRISYAEAERTLISLNSRLGRNYGESDLRAFFSRLDTNNDGFIDVDEFKAAIYNLFS